MKIAVLVSGGVDSSLALKLLKEQGHELVAFYLKIWLEDEVSFLGTCPWEEDLTYAQAVCDQLGVELRVVSLQKEYWERVVAYALNEIKQGRTPNPDVMCNQQIKFGMFLDHIDDSFEKVATGHYAQVEEVDGVFRLKQAPDPVKDQTYFLCYLSQPQLKRALFPIGHLTKEQVRALAAEYDLPTKSRKDSQGICFLGKLKFNDFIKQYLGEQTGDLVEYETGKVLGTHKGFWFHTIGQRQGLGLAGGPWYVVAKDIPTNRVFISRNYYTDDKKRDELTVAGVRWISELSPDLPVYVKLRHGPAVHQALVTVLSNDRVHIKLAQDDQGIAAGQFAVIYQQGYCIGAGVIESSGSSRSI